MLYKFSLKKYFLRKKDGQSILIVLVISTLTMLLLLGIAGRLNLTRENIRRSGEFDRAFASSENALNDIISSFYNANCIPTNLSSTEFKQIEGCEDLEALLAEENANVFAKLNEEAIDVSVNQPVSLNFGGPEDESGVTLSGARIRCGTTIQPVRDPNVRFLVSIVYFDAVQNEYKILKGTSNCQSVDSELSNEQGNIGFYNSSSELILNPNSINPTQVSNVKLIRLRLLDGSPSTKVSISGRICDANGQNCRDEGKTGSYDFMVVGLGGLGSDNIIKFQLSKGTSDNNLAPLFDFVYFGEDI